MLEEGFYKEITRSIDTLSESTPHSVISSYIFVTNFSLHGTFCEELITERQRL